MRFCGVRALREMDSTLFPRLNGEPDGKSLLKSRYLMEFLLTGNNDKKLNKIVYYFYWK